MESSLRDLLEQVGVPPVIISAVVLLLTITVWGYSQNWWGIRDRINRLMRVPEVVIALDPSSYFYVPSDERNWSDERIDYYSFCLPILTIKSVSQLVVHSIDVFVINESMVETSDCDRVILPGSKHTAEWLAEFRNQFPTFGGTEIKADSSKKISIPKCAVTTRPMRGYGESSDELPHIYLIIIIHIHVSYLVLLCRIHEMSPRIHGSTILAYETRDNKDDEQLQRWAKQWKDKDFRERVQGVQAVEIRL